MFLRQCGGGQEGIITRLQDQRGHTYAFQVLPAAALPVVIVYVPEAVEWRCHRVIEVMKAVQHAQPV